MSATPHPTDPLAPGITVLQASAGTGKTFTIASLALVHVAHGTPLERILIATFTRMATGELRERVRTRLVEAERALAQAQAGHAPPDTDEVIADLLTGGPADVALRLQRVRRALADFDAATITTTHGFCQEVLDGLGVAGDCGRGIEVSDNLDGLLGEVVTDLYVRRYAAQAPPAQLSMGHARSIAQWVTSRPDATIVGDDDGGSASARTRVDFARAARREFDRRKRQQRLYGYDDLLSRLRDALADPERGPGCRQRVRDRFDVVLIDEFQDTDPVQWRIVADAFGDVALALVGDPKQAIYGFRGADIHTYLAARGEATQHRTLGVNWRSDAGLLTALDALFRGAQLGPDIHVSPVRAARAPTAPAALALAFRVVGRDHPDLAFGTQGGVLVGSARAVVVDDVARHIAEMLRPARVDPDAPPPAASDIGVLTRTNAQAFAIRDALLRVGVAAVVAGTGSVFGSPAAEEWRRLLAALDRPWDAGCAAAVALTPFVGLSGDRLARATDAERDALHQQLHGWRALRDRRGVAALAQHLMSGALMARVLGQPGGERHLTDLRHIGQLLSQAQAQEQLASRALGEWLEAAMVRAEQDASEERARRLEADRQAVQVVTVHRSKGLEYPITCLPFLWDSPQRRRDDSPAVVHDDAGGRLIDVSGDGPDLPRRRAEEKRAAEDEELRLAYVALTRARHRCVVWWAGVRDARYSPLARLLVGNDGGGQLPTVPRSTPDDDTVRAALDRVAADAPGCVEVIAVAGAGAPVMPPAPAAPAQVELSLARFGRAIDTDWGRHSYSAITHGTYEPPVASEPEQLAPTGEPEVPDAAGAAWSDLPGGTAFGSLVHQVLEGVDFAAPDTRAALVQRMDAQWAPRGVDRDLLADRLQGALETPLGGSWGGLRLRDIAMGDRLNEMDFELPLVGATTAAAGGLTTAEIAGLLEAHLPRDDPFAGYAADLRAAGIPTTLRGFMVGSIDLVARVRGDHGERFAVIDYKTNRLRPDDGGEGAYHPDLLVGEMHRHHYVLQALIYLVALHRYLRGRLPAYDPARHLGGAHYLFLRGMVGPDTPVDPRGRCHGVMSWTPPATLVVAASDLFHRGAR